MAKKFKARRRIKVSKVIKWLFLGILIFFLYQLFKWALLTISLTDSNEKFIKYILEDNNYYSYYEKKNENILSVVFNYATNNLINEPTNILKNGFYYVDKTETKEEIRNDDVYISDPNPKVSDKPLVYIYNSHQTEMYSMEYLEDYNITPTVLMAAYIMKERLNNIGIETVVEDADISSYLKENNMKYYQSYDASRYYLKKTMEKYNSVVLYIDLHRDAINHSDSTVTIDGLDCAKIMFVVGKEYDTYLSNLENTNKLNNMIKDKYPTLTRGVMQKEGEGVNGVYNQDLDSNIILLEIGGNYNNISEVLNTIDLITPIIGEYVNEKK